MTFVTGGGCRCHYGRRHLDSQNTRRDTWSTGRNSRDTHSLERSTQDHPPIHWTRRSRCHIGVPHICIASYTSFLERYLLFYSRIYPLYCTLQRRTVSVDHFPRRYLGSISIYLPHGSRDYHFLLALSLQDYRQFPFVNPSPLYR